MARLRFAIGTRFLQAGQVYAVRSYLADGKLNLENISFGGHISVTYDELYASWTVGDLRFEVPSAVARRPENAALATEYTVTDFQALPEAVRSEAWRRYRLLLPLLQMERKQRTRQTIQQYAERLRDRPSEFAGFSPAPGLAAANQYGANDGYEQSADRVKRACVGRAVSRTSIERWLRLFETSGYDIRALVPATHDSGGKAAFRLDAAVERILDTVIRECKAKPKHRTVGDVVSLVANRVADENRFRHADTQLQVPSKSTIYTRIRSAGAESLLQRPPSHLEQQAARSTGLGPNSKLDHILERVEIDHTVLDLFVVDDDDRLPVDRPTLTYALDVYSGMPWGIYVGYEPASYSTIMQCLLYGILPKPDIQANFGTKNPWPVFGLPETLYVDNGKDFIGHDLDDACAQLGIKLERAPIRSPWFKGSIERAFRTINQGLVHKLPGTTFGSIAKRGDYDPEKHAVISLTAFWQALHVFLVDEYAQRWHEGKNGVPAKIWHESIQGGYEPSLPASADDLRILLASTDLRTVQRTGIDFESLRYQSPALARLRTLLPHNTQVRIKYDPSDMGAIYVHDPTTEGRRGEWIQVPALAWEYAEGLSLWKHGLLRTDVLSRKRDVNERELLDAKAHWQAVVEREFTLTRKAKGARRKAASRYLGKAVGTPTPITGAYNQPQPALATLTSDTGTGTSAQVGPPEPVVIRRKKRTSAPPAPRTLPVNEQLPTSESDDGWGGDYNLPRHNARPNPPQPPRTEGRQ